MNYAIPPVLSMARVLAYAIVDESVSFSGYQRLYVDGELLGRVPRLALCQPLSCLPVTDVLIFHCDDKWNVLGVACAKSFDAAQSEAERCYPGISRKWIKKTVTEKEAKKWIEMHHKNAKCSFCGRLPFEVETCVSHNAAVICNVCIDEFYEEIHRKS